MSRGRAALQVGLAVLAAGCGLQLSGSTSSAADGGSSQASLPPTGDGGPLASGDGAAGDGGSGDGGATCRPATILDDSLLPWSTTLWKRAGDHGDYPAVRSVGAGRSMLAINAPMQSSQRSGIFLLQQVPTVAFDVRFDYFIECPNNDQCADGLAAAWVDAPAATTAPTDGLGGLNLFVPKARGGAIVIATNVNLRAPRTDDTFPVLRVHQMTTGLETTLITSSGQNNGLIENIRSMTLKLRQGVVTATTIHSTNGNVLTVTGTTASGFPAWFSLTAATGANHDAVHVSSFHGEFYDCDPGN